jgi:hypothetical protein
MRNFILTAKTARRPAMMCIALSGQASSRMPYGADVTTSRAHSILVASRVQNILA